MKNTFRVATATFKIFKLSRLISCEQNYDFRKKINSLERRFKDEDLIKEHDRVARAVFIAGVRHQ